MTEKVILPPSANHAEKAIIGACLRDPGTISETLASLHPTEFYNFAHRKLFEGIGELFVAGKTINPATMAEWVHAKGLNEDIAPAYLIDLWDSGFGPPTAETAIVKSKAITRELQHSCRQILHEIDRPSMPESEILDLAERLVFAIGQKRSSKLKTMSIGSVIDATTDRLEARVEATRDGKHATVGISTGFIDLDFLLGGYQDNELVIIGARPSVGKTALGLNSFYSAMRAGKTCLFFSLEQGHLELGERFVSMDALVDSHSIRRGRLTDRDKANVVESRARFAKLKSWIVDRSNLSVAQIANECRRLKAAGDLDMVFIDYLQFVQADDRRAPRHEQVAEISRRLKMLARELGIPVVVMTQLNRQVEGQNRRPRLSDLKESGQIEQDADTVVLLHNPASQSESTGSALSGAIDVIVAKQRNGPTGETQLYFQREFYRFGNWANGAPP